MSADALARSANVNLDWSINSPVDVLGVVILVGMVLLAAVWLVRAVGTGALRRDRIKKFFTGKKEEQLRREPVAAPDYTAVPLLPERYAREVLVLVERTIDHHEILTQLTKTTLTRQMRAYEELIVTATAIVKDGFMSVATSAGFSGAALRHEKKTYMKIVKSFLGEDVLKYAFRSWCLANHFYAMTDDERERYVASKISVMFHLVTDYLDDEWPEEHALTRDQIAAVHNIVSVPLTRVIEELFKRVFRESEDGLRETNEEKAKYSAYVMAVSGYDPYDITQVRR